jgi:hypothetical protein
MLSHPHQTSGALDTFSERMGFSKGALLASGAIAGLTTLFAIRSPRHALGIVTAGAASIILAMAVDLGKFRR